MDKNDNELLKLIPFLEKLVELVSVCFLGFSHNCQRVPLIFSLLLKVSESLRLRLVKMQGRVHTAEGGLALLTVLNMQGCGVVTPVIRELGTSEHFDATVPVLAVLWSLPLKGQ